MMKTTEIYTTLNKAEQTLLKEGLRYEDYAYNSGDCCYTAVWHNDISMVFVARREYGGQEYTMFCVDYQGWLNHIEGMQMPTNMKEILLSHFNSQFGIQTGLTRGERAAFKMAFAA